MPVKSLLGKIKENTTIVSEMVGETVSGMIKEGADKKSAASGKKSLNAIKTELAALLKEKSQMLGVLGREAYALYQADQNEMTSLTGYFEKVAELDLQIDALRQEKELVAQQNQLKRTCACGKKLARHDKFCPDCGVKIDTGAVSGAGDTLLASGEAQQKAAGAGPSAGRRCVCGAIIGAEQDFCGECGRV